MRKTLMMSAAVVGLAVSMAGAAGSAMAQMSPAPNSTAQTPPTDTGMTGMRPMRGQARHAAAPQPATPSAAARKSSAMRSGSAADTGIDAPRGGDYRGGAGSPYSTSASNIDRADTRSQIAPRLPDPNSSSNTPESYLAAAQRALASNRTGAAQEALERAETRLLSRSTEPSMAASPADMPMVQQIGVARRALANRDTAGARNAISMAMGSGGVEPVGALRSGAPR